MNLRITWVPAIGAILFMITCCLASANAQQFGTPDNEQDLRKTQPVSGNSNSIPLSIIPGAHSFALFSGTEFNLFSENEHWLTSQLAEMDSEYVLQGLDTSSFEPVPPLESIVKPMQVTGKSVRVAFFDEDQTKPAATATNAPPKPPVSGGKRRRKSAGKTKAQTEKTVIRRRGRTVLNKAISQSGWRIIEPQTANADKSRTNSAQKEISVTLVPQPAPSSTGTFTSDLP